MVFNTTTYATHTEIIAANPRPTNCTKTSKCDWYSLVNPTHHWSPSVNTCDLVCGNEHFLFHVTVQHPLTTNSFARTTVQRAPTAITLFPPISTFSLEQCTCSCHRFPLRRAVGFFYACEYALHHYYGWKKIVYPCYRCLPFRLTTPPISRYPRPEGEPCTAVHIAFMLLLEWMLHVYAAVRTDNPRYNAVDIGIAFPLYVRSLTVLFGVDITPIAADTLWCVCGLFNRAYTALFCC